MVADDYAADVVYNIFDEVVGLHVELVFAWPGGRKGCTVLQRAIKCLKNFGLVQPLRKISRTWLGVTPVAI